MIVDLASKDGDFPVRKLLVYPRIMLMIFHGEWKFHIYRLGENVGSDNVDGDSMLI